MRDKEYLNRRVIYSMATFSFQRDSEYIPLLLLEKKKTRDKKERKATDSKVLGRSVRHQF
jgi:hypothetical protein